MKLEKNKPYRFVKLEIIKMNKIIYTIIFIAFFTNCDMNSKRSNKLSVHKFSQLIISSDNECTKSISNFALSEKSINQFVHKVLLNENQISSLKLIFYKEEGEVIYLYKNAILISDKETKIKYSLNDGEIKVDVKSDQFYLDNFMQGISVSSRPTNNEILIINIEEEKIKCNMFMNIKSLEILKDRLFL
ncbi:hypothetical protein [Aquimarina macrocephali]|uniref:hypothetical protein n=1 Tax=Aquimarina macrocephali TaxID=666563 RepID=UPI003F66AB78